MFKPINFIDSLETKYPGAVEIYRIRGSELTAPIKNMTAKSSGIFKYFFIAFIVISLFMMLPFIFVFKSFSALSFNIIIIFVIFIFIFIFFTKISSGGVSRMFNMVPDQVIYSSKTHLIYYSKSMNTPIIRAIPRNEIEFIKHENYTKLSTTTLMHDHFSNRIRTNQRVGLFAYGYTDEYGNRPKQEIISLPPLFDYHIYELEKILSEHNYPVSATFSVNSKMSKSTDSNVKAKKICDSCGTINPANAVYCIECGALIKS